MPPSKSKPWSFWWLCSHCDRPMEYLVNELTDQDVVWARCRRCSALVRVTDEHRSMRSDQEKQV